MGPIAAPARPGADGSAGQASVLDGRARRRLDSYERAVDALLDLLEAGNPAPTAQEIAARSGISVRTVFRLTEDIETLHAAAVTRQMERTAHLYQPLAADRLAAGSARIADGLALHHLVLRTQVAELFETTLASMPPSRRVVALDAADVAAGWETWDLLRRTRGLGPPAAAKVVAPLLQGVLTPPTTGARRRSA